MSACGLDPHATSVSGNCQCNNHYEKIGAANCTLCNLTDWNRIGNGTGKGCKCDINSTLVGSTCVCLTDYVTFTIQEEGQPDVRTNCVQCHDLYANSTSNGNGYCMCQTGFAGDVAT